MKPPKIKYKNGVMKLNPNNLYKIDDVGDIEEVFYISLRESKRIKKKYQRISYLCMSLQLQIGHWITKEYFEEVLDYVDLIEEDIIDYINFKKKIGDYFFFEWKWYYNLNKRKKKNGKNKIKI